MKKILVGALVAINAFNWLSVSATTVQQEVITPEMKVHFIDVGQADSIFIETPSKKTILIDAGNNADGQYVVNYIKNRGHETIDVLIGTHPHEDHIGGLDDVIDNFNIGSLYMPTVQYDTETFKDVYESAKLKSEVVLPIKVGTEIAVDPLVDISVLAPVLEKYDNVNNYSPIIKFDYNDFEMLLTGDAEQEVELALVQQYAGTDMLDVDVLKAGHHGSDTSSAEVFIQATTPAHTVISVGTENQYGHPSTTVMDRLIAHNSAIYRTDVKGTYAFVTNGTEESLKIYELGRQNPTEPASQPYVPGTVVAPQPVKPVPPVVTTPPSKGEMVWTTGEGTKYHRSGCRYVKDYSRELDVNDAKAQGYEPCKVCH